MNNRDYQIIELTNDEAWAIDFCVRQADHGKPWGGWGENLLRKVFHAISETEGKPNTSAVLLLSSQELWAVENQVRHTYQAGNVPVGHNLLLKVQAAILALTRDPAQDEPAVDTGADASTHSNQEEEHSA